MVGIAIAKLFESNGKNPTRIRRRRRIEYSIILKGRE
jgi:hypothetical protein